MGKRIKRKVFVLQFEGNEDLEGANVRVASISLGKMIALGDETERLRMGAGLGEVKELIDLFTQKLEFWDLEDEDGTEIPQTREGLLSLDFDVAASILVGWQDAITAVSDPLGKRSTSSPEVSSVPDFRMDPL